MLGNNAFNLKFKSIKELKVKNKFERLDARNMYVPEALQNYLNLKQKV